MPVKVVAAAGSCALVGSGEDASDWSDVSAIDDAVDVNAARAWVIPLST